MSLHCFAQDTCRFTFKFPSDQFSLSKTQIKSLDSLIAVLDEATNTSTFYIQGHADNTGDKLYNVSLSEKRCLSLKNFLRKKGVEENRISLEKFGAELPVADNETESGRADNRRTILTIVTKFPAPDWYITPQSHEVNSSGRTIITTRNGCKVTVPEDAFELPELYTPGVKIELEITEFNNPAYFIASGIPMSYKAAGKLFMYHSEEMLSIKAFYRTQPINLKDSVKITLNCRKADSIANTGFYKFNLKEQKWFEDEKAKQTVEVSIEKKSSERAKGKVEKKSAGSVTTETIGVADQAKREPKKIPELKLDTGWIVKARIDTGGVKDEEKKDEKKKEKKIDSLAYVCKPNCCQAWYYIILAQKLSEKPIDLAGLDLSFKSLYTRKAADQTFLSPLLGQTEERIGSKKFYHIKLVSKKLFLRRKALIKFKYDKDMNPELKALRKVKWVYRFKDNSENYTFFKNRAFHDIRIAYDSTTKTAAVKLEEKGRSCEITLRPKTAKGTMDEKIWNYQKILTPRILSIYSCLWAFNKEFVDRREEKQTFKDWVAYFNTHLNEVHARYDSLNRNLNTFIDGLNCSCPTPECFDCSPCDSCIPDSSGKKLLRRSGPNRILIIGLGLYNFDRVIPIEDVLYFNAPIFKDKRGRTIRPKESFLILEGVKGVIHQDKSFMLIANYRNTLFIVDKANRRYKLVLEPSEKLRQHNGTFVLKEITARTRTLEGLESELLGK